MRHYILIAILAAIPVSARADGEGAQFAVRSAFSEPLGSIDSHSKFSDGITGFVPVSAELGYRFSRQFYAGLLAGYGFGIVKNCPAGFQCSAHTIAVGLEAQFHFAPGRLADPWVGAGTGYEWFVDDASAGGTTASGIASGFQFAALEAGLDFAASPKFSVGPIVSASLGEYTSEDVTIGTTTQSPSFGKAIHGFLSFGLRVSFLP